VSSKIKSPFRKSTKTFASCHNASVSEGFLESSLVKASWAGASGKNLLGGDEEVDVVKVVALGWVHGLSPPLDSKNFFALS